MNFNKQFKEAVKDLSKDIVCQKLKIARPTYDNWISGKRKPHHMLHETIFKLINMIST